jgi:hypothetical protein
MGGQPRIPVYCTSVIAMGLARRSQCGRVATAVIFLHHIDPTTLIVHSQALSSTRASPRLGYAIPMGVPGDPTLDASATQCRTAPPLTQCDSVPGHRSSTSGSSATNMSCQYPVCGQLAVLGIGAGQPLASDGGRRRAVTTATLTRSGHCAACCTFRIHRYGVIVSALHFGDAREWRCAILSCRFAARKCERRVLWVCRDVLWHSMHDGAPRRGRSARAGSGHAAFQAVDLNCNSTCDDPLLSATASLCLPRSTSPSSFVLHLRSLQSLLGCALSLCLSVVLKVPFSVSSLSSVRESRLRHQQHH